MTDRLANQTFFDRWAPSFEKGRMSTWFQHYQNRVVEHFETFGGGDSLDVGCGTGWLVRTLAARFPGNRAWGVDLSGGMLRAARAGARHEGLESVLFVNADSAHLPFVPRAFDVITCTASFHHYPDPLAVLQAWRRILRPGGRLLLLESCTSYWPIWLYDRALRLFERGHVRYYRTLDLVRLVEQAGFRQVRPLWRERGMCIRGKLFSSLVLVEGVVPG